MALHHHIKPHHHYATWAVVALIVILSASVYTNATLANEPSQQTKAFFGDHGDDNGDDNNRGSMTLPSECVQAQQQIQQQIQGQQSGVQPGQSPTPPAGSYNYTPPANTTTTSTATPNTSSSSYPAGYTSSQPTSTSSSTPTTSPSYAPSPSPTAYLEFPAPNPSDTSAYQPTGSYPPAYTPNPQQAGATGQAPTDLFKGACGTAMRNKIKDKMSTFHQKLDNNHFGEKLDKVQAVIDKLKNEGLKKLKDGGVDSTLVDKIAGYLDPMSADLTKLREGFNFMKTKVDDFYNDSDPEAAIKGMQDSAMRDRAGDMAKYADDLVSNADKLKTALDKASTQLSASSAAASSAPATTGGGTNGQ